MRQGFVGWKLKCCGSFSRIVKLEEGGREGESYELYVFFLVSFRVFALCKLQVKKKTDQRGRREG